MDLPNLFNNLSCFGDNVCTSEAYYACHFHRVPASTEGWWERERERKRKRKREKEKKRERERER